MKFRCRAMWGALLSGAVLVHVACGSDDSGSNNAGDDAGDGSAGENSGGSNGDDGGSGGPNGGSGGTGTGGGGAGGSAQADGGGVDGSDSGPSCLALEDVPAPVQATVDAAPVCAGQAPCGGNVDGTSWAYLDVCVDQNAAFAEVYAECPASQLNGVGDRSVSGTLSFAGGVATHQATITGTGVFQVPVECHACNCKDFQEVTLYNMGVSAFCYEECYPDLSCRCLVDFEFTVDESETYTVSGNTITLASGRTYDYCSGADGLSLADTSTSPLVPGTIELVPPAALDTPEICDGLDNDHNGTVDDNPVECPTDCNTQGVCAEVERVCAGSWSCQYTSGFLEMGDETRCDGLDNDCDGEVDEGIVGCVEICDGLDNDNNGTIDDNLTDSACPTNRGVCTAGVNAVCTGASGWRCDYTSPAHRPTETLCDTLDNDCDGLVDEGCTCSTGTSKMFVLRKGMTDAGIVRANLDGSNPELILPMPQNYIFDLAIDPQNEKIYFYEFAVDQLQRANLDGTGREPVWNGLTQQFAIDPGTPQRGFVENDTYTIRSFLFATPTTVPTIITPAAVSGFAVDPINQHIYWSDHGFTWENGIMRANYDGTNPTGVALSNIYYPGSMAVDPVNKRLYYNGAGGTHRAELDGDDDQVVVTPSGQNAGPSDLALDLAGGKIYISEEGADMVRRANLDGSNIEPLLSGADVEGAEAIVIYVCAP